MYPVLFSLLLAVNPTVDEVRFSGELGLPEKELHKVTDATKPNTIIPFLWKKRPELTDEAMGYDAAMLAEHYARAGYFAAHVEPRVEGRVVEFAIDAGPKREMKPGWDEELCRRLLEERKTARAEGRIDFDAFASVKESDAVPRFWTGETYKVGRIDFSGNRAFKDATLRRAMTFDEGDALDLGKLNASLSRLAAFGQADVRIERDVERRIGHVSFALKEPGRGNWNLSGPVGPPNLFGPLTASIGMRLPVFSTWQVALNAPLWTVSLARMYLPGRTVTDEWLSGFVWSPMASWRGMALGWGLNQLRAKISPPPQRWDPLIVRIRAPEGTSAILCEPKGPRLRWLRMAAGMAVEWGLPAVLF